MKFVYLIFSIFVLPSLVMAEETGALKGGLCTHIAKLVSKGQAFSLSPSSVDKLPKEMEYTDIDIDGDGIFDSVKVGCGSGECLLQVKLSTGAEFDLDEELFYLIRYQSHIYALVSESEDEDSKDPKVYKKLHLVRLYLIAANGPKLVCGK